MVPMMLETQVCAKCQSEVTQYPWLRQVYAMSTYKRIASEASDALGDSTGDVLQGATLRDDADNAGDGAGDGRVEEAGNLAALKTDDWSSGAALSWGGGHNAGGEESSEAAEGNHFE